MSCCVSLSYLWTKWSCKEKISQNSVELLIDYENNGNFSASGGLDTNRISSQDAIDALALGKAERLMLLLFRCKSCYIDIG